MNSLSSTIVVGDVHGDLNQFLYPLKRFLSNPIKYKIVYLGDYIDRGESNVYIYEILRVLFNAHPHIHFVCGNHETYDSTTWDYISYNNKSAVGKGDTLVKTFVYDLMQKVDFPVVYYDKVMRIVYSHSPQNRPLSQVLEMKRTSETTTTTMTKDIGFVNVNGRKKAEYKNIHGHDHAGSKKDEIKDFFATDEVNCISLDVDASYGFGMIRNAFGGKKKGSEWTKGAKSKVYYLVIDEEDDANNSNVNSKERNDENNDMDIDESNKENKEIKKYKGGVDGKGIENISWSTTSFTIEYGSQYDNNVKTFENIKSLLIEWCNDEKLKKKIKEELSLDTSWKYWKKAVKGEYALCVRDKGMKGGKDVGINNVNNNMYNNENNNANTSFNNIFGGNSSGDGMGNVVDMLRAIYERQMSKQKGEVTVFFQDAPYEFYKMSAMEEGKNAGNELKGIAENEMNTPLHELYWTCIVDGKWKEWKERGLMERMTGGMLSNGERMKGVIRTVVYVLFFIIVACCLVAMIGYSWKNRKRDVSGDVANDGGKEMYYATMSQK